MQTSGPIRQDLGLHHAEGFGDIKPFAKNLYEATCDGKKCLLKCLGVRMKTLPWKHSKTLY